MRWTGAALALVLGLGPIGSAAAPGATPSCPEAETAGRQVVRVAAGPDGSPRPWRTALDAVRADPERTRLELEGTVFLDAPLRLGPEHAGLVLAAGPAGATLLGGADLSGLVWRVAPDGAREARLDPTLLPEGPLDLHLDGRRLEPARHPNATPDDRRSGWLFTAPGTEGTDAFRARPTDLAVIEPEPGLSVLIYDAPQWSTNLVRVGGIDRRRAVVELADNVAWHRLGPHTPYFWLGSRRFLDAPGEWHFDTESRTLAVRPPDGVELTGRRLVGARLDTLLLLEGTRDVVVHGLALASGSPHGSDRRLPWNHIGGGAVRVENARSIALCALQIQGVGVGIALHSVEDALVAGNRVGGTAGNGIYVGLPWGGRPSRRVRIEGNVIEDVGHRFADSAGILLQGVEDVVVVDNHVARTAQFGVYAMQSRATGEDAIRRVRIERNRIVDSNLRTADGGGIKLFAAVQDEPMAVTIRANWIDGTSHLMARPDGSFFAPDAFDPARWPQPIAPGIYLDWYARGVRVESNLITRAYAGVSIVNGSDNQVVGNVVIGPVGAALGVDNKTPATPGRPPMADNRFEANIVLLDRPGSLAVQIWDLAEAAGAARFAGNLYGGPAFGSTAFVAGPDRLPGGRRVGDLATWSRSRYVAGPEHRGEPGFRDRARGDLRPAPDGLAARLGMPALDPRLLEAVGRAGLQDRERNRAR